MNLSRLLDSDLNNVLIIAPDDLKYAILEDLSERKTISDVKFMDLNEFRQRSSFTCDLKAVRHLMKTRDISIANAEELLRNLYAVETDRDYGNERLNELGRIRKELDDLGLLIHDELFERQIRNRRIIVIGYGEISSYDEKLINGEVIVYPEQERHYEISCYEDIGDEAEGLYNAIYDLLLKGTDINSIHIIGSSSDYESYFKRFNDAYPFTVRYVRKDPLIATALGKRFVAMLEKEDRETIYEYLNTQDSEAASSLKYILNSYPEYRLQDVKDMIINDVKHTLVGEGFERNTVQCSEMFTHFNDDDHVFLIGFNDLKPAYRRDTDYLSDREKKLLGMETSEEENLRIRKNCRAYLYGIRNLHISYSRKSPFRKYNRSSLLKEDEYTDIHPQNDRNHSAILNSQHYGMMRDEYVRYRTIDEGMPLLHKYCKDSGYGEYDNRFSSLEDRQAAENRKVVLSYSSMDDYYKCAFRYYLKHVLNLDEQEDTFNTIIGTQCHEVLKDMYREKDFDFDVSWEKNLKDIELSESEKFFLEKVKEELRQDIEIIRKQDENSLLNKHLCEQKFEHVLDDQTSFKGYIDKVSLHEGKDETIAAVIDYKTGSSASIEKDLMPYGLSLQLPSYMYLLKNDPRFADRVRYAGFYLQRLLSTDLKYQKDKDSTELREESLKLMGLTSADSDRAQCLDQGLAEGKSQTVSGLRLKKDGGFYSNSPIISDEETDELIKLVDEKIGKAAEAIRKGEFTIDPKEIDRKNRSCKYCDYAAVCYLRNSDLKVIYTKQESGEDDG